MDIRLVIVKSLVYSFLLALVAGVYVIVAFYFKDILEVSLNIPNSLTLILTGLIIAFGFEPTRRVIEKKNRQYLL